MAKLTECTVSQALSPFLFVRRAATKQHWTDRQLHVHLQPYDMVVFLSNQLNHSTMAVEGDPYDEERWSICFHQRN
ncbi:uncharacterized protein SEPMUDRAFT_43969 [Sphaerulina musiva SO2202]|uniref:Uncharacterized protein n=1 Tax=Sphaerulina musiva (strain SO2202) TaxID=692275 RepID=M3CFB0_SPHMS|nr:uncharacterized protein SEPMUDRAFT_43969 [Sphaerulina musiva SO2202]EMF12498.1 hypothetical protein SEPMUDRAFT_43969 [Sphaerulina musiva SO2202]